MMALLSLSIQTSIVAFQDYAAKPAIVRWPKTIYGKFIA
jgi:hypothetical protein